MALYCESARRDESALAEEELASALASLGQKAEAREAVRRAQALLAGNSSQVARPAVEITAGLLQPAASPAERGAVRGTLQAALDAARRTGVVEDELRARLGLADLEPPSTAPSGDLARRALAREARARGFELYARRAEQSRPTTQ